MATNPHDFICFYMNTAMTPAGFSFSPMLAVIVVGCVASVVSIACIIAVAVAVSRKRSRRRRRQRASDESKTAIDGGGGGVGGGGPDGGDGGGDDGIGNGCGGANGVTGGGGGGGGGDRHHHRAEPIDDGLEKNPDIIPHDNGKTDDFSIGFFLFSAYLLIKYYNNIVFLRMLCLSKRGRQIIPKKNDEVYSDKFNEIGYQNYGVI